MKNNNSLTVRHMVWPPYYGESLSVISDSFYYVTRQMRQWRMAWLEPVIEGERIEYFIKHSRMRFLSTTEIDAKKLKKLLSQDMPPIRNKNPMGSYMNKLYPQKNRIRNARF